MKWTRLVDEINVRHVAMRIAAPFSKDGAWNFSQLAVLFHFVKKRMRYQADPYGIEYTENPLMALRLGAGDCDDQAILMASLLGSMGIPWRLHHLINFDSDGDKIAHLIAEAYVGNTISHRNVCSENILEWYGVNTGLVAHEVFFLEEGDENWITMDTVWQKYPGDPHSGNFRDYFFNSDGSGKYPGERIEYPEGYWDSKKKSGHRGPLKARKLDDEMGELIGGISSTDSDDIIENWLTDFRRRKKVQQRRGVEKGEEDQFNDSIKPNSPASQIRKVKTQNRRSKDDFEADDSDERSGKTRSKGRKQQKRRFG
jgi:hypothetical protein